MQRLKLNFDELVFIDKFSRFLPWLTPIYSAYLVTMFLINAGVVWPIAIIEGLVVEGLGIVAINTLLGMVEHNQSRGEGERPMPVFLVGFIAVFYTVIIILVVYFLDVTKPEHRLINGLLASLSLVSAGLIGARSVMLQRQAERQAEIIDQLQTKELERLQRAAIRAGANKQALILAQFANASGIDISEIAQAENAISASAPQIASTSASGNGNQRKQEPQVLTVDQLAGTRLKIYEALQNEPELTNKQVAEKLGISHQAVSPYRRELAKSGLVELSPRSRK